MERYTLTSVREFIYRKHDGDIKTFAQLHRTSVYKVNEWIRRDAHIINGKICIPTRHSA
ncbi:Uncharacterised protein [Serratia fonticola]|nr:Uncharacterised protein [Serratia fonticola]CAI0792818.1 Uncharacterised protein [Serratia fonticola]CAI1655828.1 Uncharacterised protein [Serratia fonticola]CAI1769536.1 Uncharacterised protein [Serratia fonticola]CAI1978831.1 Uncharacterised protein [Serratia fonticola]